TLADEYRCKPALAGGAFERTVREVGFERLVCVSNVQNTIRLLSDLGRQPDSLEILFNMCWGAFSDLAWFRRVTMTVPGPGRRVSYIDFSEDWWYLDDLAAEYFEKEGLAERFAANAGGRILAPPAQSDGSEILAWLRGTLR
ncbi:MAG TPA: hypothetical protein VL099_12385, partial [Candidatus Binatia bacterium]|nr:hypothetical protein [Candidatus Binatia bacterium]